ncbi:MAG TPA: SRPBCC family protein [Pseudonocardiaceae bacterium]
MIDIVDELNHAHREAVAGDSTSVLLRRDFDATVEDVWDACTDPTRISRWFLPVTGEFTVGGHYQLVEHAGGEILRCEAPRLLRVTWVFGDLPPSEVEVRLSPAATDRTLFELEHSRITEPAKWERFGPGAVGVGWDLLLLGLRFHLADPTAEKPDPRSIPGLLDFITGSSTAWGAAYEKSGATPDQAASAVANTTAFYTGTPS